MVQSSKPRIFFSIVVKQVTVLILMFQQHKCQFLDICLSQEIRYFHANFLRSFIATIGQLGQICPRQRRRSCNVCINCRVFIWQLKLKDNAGFFIPCLWRVCVYQIYLNIYHNAEYQMGVFWQKCFPTCLGLIKGRIYSIKVK